MALCPQSAPFRGFVFHAVLTWILSLFIVSPGSAFPAREDSAPPPLPSLRSILATLPSGDSATQTDTPAVDTLSLPDLEARGRRGDSVSREFRKYWAEYEKREGFDELRNQVRAATDIDMVWVPRLYFFDSSLVIFPAWFVWRKKPRR